MKLLKRNLTKFDYYEYLGLGSDLNEDGLHTGEPTVQYNDPVTYEGNISAPSGEAKQAFDGVEISYSHVLVMDDPNVNINEYGYIEWKNKTLDIKAVRPSLNSVTIALKERIADNGDQDVEENNDPVIPVNDSGEENNDPVSPGSDSNEGNDEPVYPEDNSDDTGSDLDQESNQGS